MEHLVQPVPMRKITSDAHPDRASGSNKEGGTSQTCVPDPYLSVLNRVKTVNVMDASHAGRRRA